jgi:hypothetical protein
LFGWWANTGVIRGVIVTARKSWARMNGKSSLSDEQVKLCILLLNQLFFSISTSEWLYSTTYLGTYATSLSTSRYSIQRGLPCSEQFRFSVANRQWSFTISNGSI